MASKTVFLRSRAEHSAHVDVGSALGSRISDLSGRVARVRRWAVTGSGWLAAGNMELDAGQAKATTISPGKYITCLSRHIVVILLNIPHALLAVQLAREQCANRTAMRNEIEINEDSSRMFHCAGEMCVALATVALAQCVRMFRLSRNMSVNYFSQTA